MRTDDAETVAVTALGWLAADEDRLARLVAITGAGLDDLKARASDPEFLGFVLDHLLAHEPDLLAFAEAGGMAPETVVAARRALPGGILPEWT